MSDRTRTRSLARLLAVAALFAAIASVVIVPSWVAAVGNPGIAGSWQVTITDTSGDSRSGLATFDADGTLIVSDLPVNNGPSGVAYVSAGHGVWTAKHATNVSFTLMELMSDRQGQLSGTLTIDAQVIVAKGGDAFDGAYVVTASAPDGTALGSFSGTLAATRMTVQPMPSLSAPASPAASPAVPPAASPAAPAASPAASGSPAA